MQADAKLPVEQQRKYKNVFDGGRKIIQAEGVKSLWRVFFINLTFKRDVRQI